jgi:glutamine synthetase adenylyltransferase
MIFKKQENLDFEDIIKKNPGIVNFITEKVKPKIREELWNEFNQKLEIADAEKNRLENILNNVNTKNTFRKVLIEKTINNFFEKSKTIKPSDLKEHYLTTLEMLSDSSADHFDYFLNAFREKVKTENDPSKFDNLMLKLVDVSKRASKADSGVERFKILTEELLKKTLGMK